VARIFIAELEWLHGDYETCDYRLVLADNFEHAERLVESYLSQLWGDETVRDGDVFYAPEGAPAVRCKSIHEIKTINDLFFPPFCISE